VGIAGGLVAFVCIWMVSLFMVLPWGISNHLEAGEEVIPGTDPGAPVRPRMLLKVGITTLIAVLLWVVLYVVITYRLISL
jgi:predicted secreted protein